MLEQKYPDISKRIPQPRVQVDDGYTIVFK